MRRDDRDLGAAERRGNVLGDLARQVTPESEPEPSQWQAIASALDGGRPRRLIFAIPALAFAVVVLIASRLTLGYTTDHCIPTQADQLRVAPTATGTVAFDDGSRLSLSGGTQAHIQLRAFRRGAEIRLQSGHSVASIVHRFAGRWDVLAGPFDVHVTGTRFEVDWQPDKVRFAVLVHEGEVRVSGGSLAKEVRIHGGQSLDVDGQLGTVRVGPIPAPAAEPTKTDEKPNARETLRPTAKATPPAPAARPPKGIGIRSAGVRRIEPSPTTSPSEQPRVGEPGLVWRGDPSGGGSVVADDEPVHEDIRPRGADGFIFAAAGKRTQFLAPASGSPTHLYRDDAKLCTSVRIPALFCSGNSHTPAGEICDYETNWGVMLAWNPRANQNAWGEARADRLSFEYQGPPGTYRLTAHREGDPAAETYCVDSYVSGRVVSASDFRTECWTKGGAVLPDFSSVDTFALHRPSTNSRQTLKMCINSVSLY